MKYHPIHIGIHREDWSGANHKRSFNADPKSERKKIFERDNDTCRFCGFQAKKYQKIHHKNGYEDDFSDENCLTACVFCHQCFDLNAVSKMSSGVLIWLPEIGQAALNHIMRALYVARYAQGPLSDASKVILKTLMNRRLEAKKRLGSENPADLAVVLEDYISDRQYPRVKNKLKGIRLMPLDRRNIILNGSPANEFSQILADWRLHGGPFVEISPDKWGAMVKELNKAV